MTLREWTAKITPPDAAAMEEARRRQAQLAKPPGSLGRLEDLSVQLAGITVGACEYDAQSDCFVCPVRAQAQAYVYAVTDEDETEFTDFILKGAVK